MPPPTDTITALATPAGTAAIAVVRVSGPEAARLAGELGGRRPEARMVRHADYRTRGGALVDDVLLTFFEGPRSYTGEDALEISCHGNPFVVRTILEDLLARGCRPAGPGEFTQRAFLNGKMDLSQAEAVMDIIQARSERALAAAQHQRRGGLGRRLAPSVERLLGLLARIEAYIDFPDEDLPAEDRALALADIDHIIMSIKELQATSRFGDILRDGIKTVILGAPNAGKSSLLNRLVGRERALVSPEPGTTRDYLEERLMMGPHCLRLIDTAGLNPSAGPIERLGIEKTWERVDEADLFLLVVDASESTPLPHPAELLGRLPQDRTIVVLNKSDLPSARRSLGILPGALEIQTSALTGLGLVELRNAIVARADALNPNHDELIAINARHAVALEAARTHLGAASARLQHGGAAELAASDLRGVLDAFGEIAGRIDNEEMLDRLFATFCIGK